MCRSLRENLHFGGNAMYRTLFEGGGSAEMIPYIIYSTLAEVRSF